MLENWVLVAYRILVSAPGPFGTNWVLELIEILLGLGLGGFGTKGQGLTILIGIICLGK